MRNRTPHLTLALLAVSTGLAVPSTTFARDYGVDVSHYQGATGISPEWWTDLKAAGGTFAYIKASEGLTNADDPTMATNVARADAAGILTGVYHYAHAENRTSTAGAVQEADHFMTYAGSAIGPGHLRPVLDIEGSALTLSTTALTDWALAFINEVVAVKGAAAAPIIYTSRSSATNEFDTRVADLDLWMAYSNASLDPETASPTSGKFNNWVVWQYTATGSFEGISPLDVDVVHSEYKSLSALVIPEPTALAAVPLIGGLAFPRRRQSSRLHRQTRPC